VHGAVGSFGLAQGSASCLANGGKLTVSSYGWKYRVSALRSRWVSVGGGLSPLLDHSKGDRPRDTTEKWGYSGGQEDSHLKHDEFSAL
jgi:hypothetical protein